MLARYALWELAKVFLVSLAALTGMILLVGVVREAVNQSLPLGQVAWLLPYILPDALRIAVPVTLLLAATCVYGRMAGSNEVVAIKALGISPMVLVWPTLAAAFLLSLVTVWLNDLAVSWGRNGAQRVIIEAVEEIAYSMLRTQRSYSSPQFAINVKEVRGRKLIHPVLSLKAGNDTPGVTITAEEAELRSDREENVLKIILRNGTADVEGEVIYSFADVEEREIALQDASRAKKLSQLPSWLPLRVIPERIKAQIQIIERYEQELAAEAAYDMLTGDFHALTGRKWKTRHNERQDLYNYLHRLYTEPHRRWSAGFTSR